MPININNSSKGKYVSSNNISSARQGDYQSITPVGGMERTKYDIDRQIATSDLLLNNLERTRGESQGVGAEIINSVVGGVSKIPFSVIGNVASILDFEDYFNKDNEVGNAITAWSEEVKGDIENATKIYKSNDNHLSSREWWMDNAKGLIDSAGGFVLTGYGLGKGVQLLSELAKSSTILQSSIIGAGALSNAAMLNQAESVPIAMNVYQKAIQSGKSEEEAAEAAAYSIAINRINIPLNLTSAAAFLRTKDLTRQIAKEYSKKDVLKKLISEGSQEYVEENINMIAEKEALNKIKDGKKYSYDFNRTIDDVFSKEGFEQGLVGFLGGFAQTGLTEAIGSLDKSSPSFDENGNIRYNEDGTPVLVSERQSKNERFKAQQKSLKNIELLGKTENVNTLKETLDKIKTTSQIINEIEEASLNNDDFKVEQLKNDLLVTQSLDAFKNGTTQNLIDLYKSLSKDPSSREKFGDDFITKSNEAIKQIEDLEQIYIKYNSLPQVDEIVINRAKQNLNLKQYDALKSNLNRAFLDQQKEIEVTGYNTDELINSLASSKELSNLNNQLSLLKDNVQELNNEYIKILTPEYTKLKQEEIFKSQKEKQEDRQETKKEPEVKEETTEEKPAKTATKKPYTMEPDYTEGYIVDEEFEETYGPDSDVSEKQEQPVTQEEDDLSDIKFESATDLMDAEGNIIEQETATTSQSKSKPTETTTVDKHKYTMFIMSKSKSRDSESTINKLDLSDENVLRDLTIEVKRSPYRNDKTGFKIEHEIKLTYQGQDLGFLANPNTYDETNLVLREGEGEWNFEQLKLDQERNTKVYNFITKNGTLDNNKVTAFELEQSGLVKFTKSLGSLTEVNVESRKTVEESSENLHKIDGDVAILDLRNMQFVGKPAESIDSILATQADNLSKFEDIRYFVFKTNSDGTLRAIPAMPYFVGSDKLSSIFNDIMAQSDKAFSVNGKGIKNIQFSDKFNNNINRQFFISIDTEAYGRSSNQFQYAELLVSPNGGLTLSLRAGKEDRIKYYIKRANLKALGTASNIFAEFNKQIQSDNTLTPTQKKFVLTEGSFRNKVSELSTEDAAKQLVVTFDVSKEPYGSRIILNVNDNIVPEYKEAAVSDIERRRQEELNQLEKELNDLGIVVGENNLKESAEKLLEDIQSPFVKQVLKALLNLISKTGTTLIIVKEGGIGYNPSQNKITIGLDTILDGFNKNRENRSKGATNGSFSIKYGKSEGTAVSYFATTLLHEIVHTFTSKQIDVFTGKTKGELTKEETEILNTLQKIFDLVKTNPILKGEYGLYDLHELIAEVFSNETFADKLKNISLPKELQYKTKSKNLFEGIIDLISDLITKAIKEFTKQSINNEETAFQNISNLVNDLINAKYEAELDALEGAKTTAPVSNKKADIEIGKVGNTEYEVKSDGVYYQNKKLDNPENKTHRQLIKTDIERRRIETQSQIERTDLFDGVGNFSSELGGSNKAAVPTNRQKINGIEFVQYSHPETGSLDVIVTGTSDNNFVGFYRIYENGKPTNKWSSKFENQSRNKENFKTMISNIQDMLPEGHEYMEKTSISTDGLRVWNQQLSRGYELQYDENGKLKTNLVAINGDAIVNELGIPVNKGDFNNIKVTNKEDFEKVKKVLLPYLEKFGLNESNIRWLTGTVKIDLPVLLKSSKKQAELATLKASEVKESPKVKIEIDAKSELAKLTKKQDQLIEDGEYEAADELNKQINDLTAKIIAEEKSDDSIVYKLEDKSNEDKAVINDAINYIKSILPKYVDVKDIDKLVKNSNVKGIPVGAFLNSTIYLSKNAPKGTEVHEAFHAVFRLLLSDTESMQYLKLAKQERGTPSLSEINEFKNKYDLGNKSNQYIEDLILEEYLADKFVEWKLSKEKNKSKFFKLFDKIVNWIKFNILNKDEISALFWKIDSGKFKNTSPILNRFNSNNNIAYALLPSGIDSEGVPKFLNSKKSESIIATATAAFVERKSLGRTEDKNLSDAQIISDILNQMAYQSSLGFHKDLLTSLTKEKREGLIKELKEENYALTNQDSLNVITKEINKRRIIFDYESNQNDENSENKSNEEGERFDINASEIGGFGSLSKAIRQLIGITIVNDVDEYGRNIKRAVDAISVYNSLDRLLANTPKSQMMSKIKNYSLYNKEVKLFYDRLKVLANYNEVDNIIDPNNHIYNSFTRAFSKSKVLYQFALIDPHNKLYKIFNANQRDVAYKQTSDWNNAFMLGFNKKTKFEKNMIVDNILKLNSKYLFKSKDLGKVIPDNELNKEGGPVYQIKKALSEIGIDLSEGYIAYSILQNRELTETQKEFVDSFKDVSPIQNYGTSNNSLGAILDTIVYGVSGKKDYTGSPFDKTIDELGVELDDSALSRLRFLAENNAIFDGTVGSSTFQNADGKTVYDKIIASYTINRLVELQGLKREDFTNFDEFKKWNKGLEEYDLNASFEFLRKNPFVNDKHLEQTLGKDFIIKMIDGVRQAEININSETEELFENLNKAKKEGKTFGSMEIRDTLLMMYGLYNNHKVKTLKDADGQIEKVTYSDYYFKVLEASKTGYVVSLPNGDYFRNNELTDSAKDKLYLFFEQEFDRIVRTKKEISIIEKALNDKKESPIPVIKDFHDGEKRGLKFFNFDKILSSQVKSKILEVIAENGSISSNLKQYIKEDIEKYFVKNKDSELNVHYKVLLDSSVITKFIKDDKEVPNKYFNRLLPVTKNAKGETSGGFAKTIGGDHNILNTDAVGNFFFNHLINTWSVNQLIDGDVAYGRKDGIDYVKRNKGNNAMLGGTYGEGTSNGAIFKEPIRYINNNAEHVEIPEDVLKNKDSLKEYIKKNKLSKVKVADAQMYETIDWRIHKLIQKGKYSDKVKSVYEKIRNDEELTKKDIKTLKDNDAMLISDKDVHFSGWYYFKLSSFPLTRQYTSINVPEGTEGAIKSTINGKYYIPNPTRVFEHNLLTEMENSGIDYAMPESASKGVSKDVSEIGKLKKHAYKNSSWGMQHEVPSNKDMGTDGTQKNGLIDSEQPKEMQPIVDEYQRVLGQRVKALTYKAMNLLKDELGSGEYTLRNIISKFNNTLQESGADINLLDFFAKDPATGEPIFDLNLPYTVGKFEQLFYAHFTSGVLATKAPMHTFVLKSGHGVKVAVDKDDNVVPSLDLKEYKEQYKLRDLAFKKKDKDGNYYSEVLIPKHFEEFGVKPGDIANDDVLKMLGFRIPTQDKHSMMTIKIVDYLPEYYGSVIIAPDQLVLLSGADFDVDKLYARRYDFYTDMNGDIKVYGKNGDDLNTRWEEFLESERNNNKDFKNELRQAKLSSPEYQDLLLKVKDDLTKSEIQSALYFKESELESKVLKKLLLPSTKEEYRKFTEEFGEINVSVLNNKLLEMEIKLYSNESMDTITKTPSSLTDLENLIEDLNIKEESGNYNIYSVNGMLASKKDNDTGKSNIGPAAVTNMIFNMFAKNNVKIIKPVNLEESFKDKYEYINSKGERINHLISTVLSAMTDNAKERMASKFNLTLDTLPSALYLIANGVSLKTTMSLMLSDVVKDFTKQLTIKNAAIKISDTNRKEENVYEKEIFQSIKDKLKEDIKKSGIDLDSQDRKFSVSDVSKNHLISKLRTIEFFETIHKDSKIFQKLNSIIQLNKGFEPSISENNEVNESIKSLGIFLNDEAFEQLGLPFDVRPIFNKNGYHRANIDAYNDVHNIAAKEFFLSRSNLFEFIETVVNNNLKKSTINSNEIKERLSKNILSYITINAYRKHLIGLSNKTVSARHLSSLNLDNLIGSENIVSRVAVLKNKYPKNQFLRNIDIDMASPKNKLMFSQLSSNTRNKLHPLTVEQILNDFNSLYLNRNTKQDAIDIFNYMVIKDGMQFKNKSLSRFIASHMFRIVSDSIKGSLNVIKNDLVTAEDFSGVFGKSKQYFVEEFLDTNFLYNEYTYDHLPFSKTINNNFMDLKDGVLTVNLFKGTNYQNNLGVMYNEDMAQEVLNKDDENKDIFKRNIASIEESSIFDLQREFSEDKGKFINKIKFPLYIKIAKVPYKLQIVDPISEEITPLPLAYFIGSNGMIFGTKAIYKKVSEFGVKDINPFGLSTEEKIQLEQAKLNVKKEAKAAKDKAKSIREGAMNYLSMDDYITEEEEFIATSIIDESFVSPETISKIEDTNINEDASEIYKKLGNKTKTNNIVIKSVYQQEGVQYAKSIGGIFSLRVNNSDKHFGNPFSSVQSEIAKGLIPTKSTKESVEKYIDWVLSDDTNINKEQHLFIREQLKSGRLKAKPIVYYKELGEPSHATALDYLINKYDWNKIKQFKQEVQKFESEAYEDLDIDSAFVMESPTFEPSEDIVQKATELFNNNKALLEANGMNLQTFIELLEEKGEEHVINYIKKCKG